MRILVIGGGSIGRRHLMNLKSIGPGELSLVEPGDARREEVAAEAGVPAFATIAEGLDTSPDVAVIATPNHLHVENAIEAGERGCHLFIEKPLSHDHTGLDALNRVVRERGLVTMVGCNMRFHPGPARVKKLIRDGAVGTLRFMRVHTGSYLPGWRPWQDYRQSYSANQSMGGGVLLDCIHEIDLTRWYGGEVTSVLCDAGRIGDLEIDTEDYAEILLRHADGNRSEVHLNYLSRTYERGCSVFGDAGTIHWEFASGEVRHYDSATETWKTYAQPPGWDVNQMYIDELRYFLTCVERNLPTTLPVADATKLMRVVFAAKQSAAEDKRVEL